MVIFKKELADRWPDYYVDMMRAPRILGINAKGNVPSQNNPASVHYYMKMLGKIEKHA